MGIDPLIVAAFGSLPQNVDLDDDQRVGNNVCVVVLLIIATIGVGLRLAARIVQRSSLEADDYAIVVALLLAYATGGLSIGGGNFGAGQHIWATQMSDFVTMMKILFSYTFVYAAAVAMIKLSILLFYYRIFGWEGTLWRASFTIAAVLTLSYPLIVWTTMANSCKPVSLFWSRFIGAAGTCIDINKFFLALGIINMLVDIVVLIIPIPQILALHMTQRRKLGICGIFLLGSFVCVASLVRITALATFMQAVDVTWYMGPVFIWSSVEPSIGILSACLPSLPPLWLHIRSKVSSQYSRSGHASTSHGKESSLKTFGQKTSQPRRMRMMGLTQEEDEISLTSVVEGNLNESEPSQRGIFIHTNIEQTTSAKAI